MLPGRDPEGARLMSADKARLSDGEASSIGVVGGGGDGKRRRRRECVEPRRQIRR